MIYPALALAVSLLGCATSKAPDPRQIAMAKHEAAAEDFRNDVAQVTSFREKADVLAKECDLLRNHPGWDDMARLVKGNASIRYIEGEEAATRKTRATMAAWSRRWDASADAFLAQYTALTARSAGMEQERLRLLMAAEQHQKEWKTAKAGLLVQVALRAPSAAASEALLGGIGTSGQRVEEAYAPLRFVLTRYSRDEMGLYHAGAQ